MRQAHCINRQKQSAESGDITLPASPHANAARLGFGTSYIHGALARDEVLALLNAAYESGIRHFDTAPMYGWGAAEELLGAFAAGKPDLVIVTKAGIAPPSKLARLIAKAPGMPGAQPSFGQFAPGQVSRSLETSLARLKVERVAALLLHEVSAADATDALVSEITKLKQDGKAGALGLATSAAHASAVFARYPDTFDIVQLPAHEARRAAGPRASLNIIHSVLGARLKRATPALASQPALLDEFGAHAGDKEAVASALLRAALAQSDGGVVLFSTTRPERVRAYAKLTPAEPATLERLQAALAEPA